MDYIVLSVRASRPMTSLRRRYYLPNSTYGIKSRRKHDTCVSYIVEAHVEPNRRSSGWRYRIRCSLDCLRATATQSV